ncbi:MAG: SirB2 family protein [Woeseiaceae bacterium]
MTYLWIRHLHTLLAVITISGFLLRGYWMLTGSDRLARRMTRIAPHVLDTLFLASGIAMLFIASLNPLGESWLIAKFVGLILYVLLGTVAIRRGDTRQVRAVAFAAAIVAFGYVAGVALTKSPASWIRYLA